MVHLRHHCPNLEPSAWSLGPPPVDFFEVTWLTVVWFGRNSSFSPMIFIIPEEFHEFFLIGFTQIPSVLTLRRWDSTSIIQYWFFDEPKACTDHRTPPEVVSLTISSGSPHLTPLGWPEDPTQAQTGVRFLFGPFAHHPCYWACLCL